MANLPPEVSDAFQDLVNALNRTRDSFDDYHDDIERVQAANNRINEQEKAARKKALDDLTSDISKVGGNLLNLGKSMSTPQGAFQAMGDITANVVKGLANLASGFGKIGAVIKGIGEVGAEAIKLLTAETGKAFAVFGKLSQSGVVENFQAMREASRQTGLTFDQLDTVLAKNSESLMLFGGSAMQGSKNLQQVIKFNRDAATNMQKMGIGFQEFAEIQANYVVQQTRAGFAQGKSNKELAAGAAKYAEELTLLSRLTGKNREELQKDRDKLMADARFRAKLATLDPAKAKIFQDMVTSMPKSMQEGMKNYLSAGGVVDKASSELAVVFGQMGMNINDINIDNIASVQRFQDEFNKRAPEFVKNTKDLVMATGTDTPFGRAFVDIADRMSLHKTSQEELMEAEKKRLEQQKKQEDDFAKAATKAQELANEFGLLITESKLVIAANVKMAEVMQQAIGVIKQLASGDLSGAGKSIMEKFDWTKMLLGALGLKTIFGGGAGGAAGGAGAGGAGAGRMMGMLGRLGTAGLWGAGAAAAGAAGYGVGTMLNTGLDKATSYLTGKRDETLGGWLADKFSGAKQEHTPVGTGGGAAEQAPKLSVIRSKSGKSAQVGAEYASKFQGLIDWLDSQGYPISSLGGYVDRDVRGQPGVKSIHARGGAIDINPSTNPMGSTLITDMPPGVAKIAASLGLGWGGNWKSVKDAMHFSVAASEGGAVPMQRGGIIGSRAGGTNILAGEGGLPEAIVPLPDGRTIPVIIKNTGEQAEFMGRVFDRLGEKMDTLISLMAQNTKYSRNIAQNTT